MAKVKVAVVVGSNRRDSINRKLAQALAVLPERRVRLFWLRQRKLVPGVRNCP